MAITIQQISQNSYNLAYGINAVTLAGLTVEDKYVLQILDGTTVVADIRQTANENGKAQFDIQNILQTYVETSAGNLETTIKWHDSKREVFEYNIAYGTETGGLVNTPLNIITGLKVIGGRKPYYDLHWNDENVYRAEVGTDGESLCSVVDEAGKPLTDWSYYITGADVDQQEPPIGLRPNDKVYVQKVRPSDNFTLSILQSIREGDIWYPAANVRGVEAYRVVEYDQYHTMIQDRVVNNTISNGGGPNIARFDGTAIADPYWVVTAGVGPVTQGILNPFTKYYYIAFPVATPTACSTEHTNLTDQSAFDWWRFEIVDDKCNDFTPIQFSWMNSLGFRDYFFFEKRNEKRLGISRNNYLAESNNYNDLFFTSDQTSRGYTTYSQQLEETYVANTRFLQDYEAAFLENLFISPDVKVRFGDEMAWYPVTLLTNTFTEKNFRKDKLFQYEISFKKAHNIKSQRG